MSIESQDPERPGRVPYPVLSTGTSHSLCLDVTSVWERAAFQGNPLPSLDRRLLERLPLSIKDVWNEEKHIQSLSRCARLLAPVALAPGCFKPWTPVGY